MKSVTRNRVIRVSPATHRAAKLAAAEEDRSLSDLASEALERELERRRRPTDPALAAALASQVPTQTR